MSRALPAVLDVALVVLVATTVLSVLLLGWRLVARLVG